MILALERILSLTVLSSCVHLFSAISCEHDLDVCHFMWTKPLYNPNMIKALCCAWRKDVIFSIKLHGLTTICMD